MENKLIEYVMFCCRCFLYPIIKVLKKIKRKSDLKKQKCDIMMEEKPNRSFDSSNTFQCFEYLIAYIWRNLCYHHYGFDFVLGGREISQMSHH